jgi:hypothetical protein
MRLSRARYDRRVTAHDALLFACVWQALSALPYSQLRREIARRRGFAVQRWREQTAMLEAGAKAVRVRADAPPDAWVRLATIEVLERTPVLGHAELLDGHAHPALVDDDGRKVTLARGGVTLRKLPFARATLLSSHLAVCFDTERTGTYAIEVPGGSALWVRGVPREQDGALELAPYDGMLVIAPAPDGLVPTKRPVEPAVASVVRPIVAVMLPLLPLLLVAASTRGVARELASGGALALVVAMTLGAQWLARWSLRGPP